jgi:hypothetical protein
MPGGKFSIIFGAQNKPFAMSTFKPLLLKKKVSVRE